MLRLVEISYEQDGHSTSVRLHLTNDPLQDKEARLPRELVIDVIRGLALSNDIDIEILG